MSTIIRGHARRAGLCLGVLGLLFVSTCHDRVTSPSVPVPSEFTLAVGEHVTIAPDQVEIGFRKVDGDSRCPTNVRCYWEGAAGVQLWLKPATGGTTLVGIEVRGHGSGTADSLGYRITVVKLDPYPQSSGSILPWAYRVTLHVDRR